MKLASRVKGYAKLDLRWGSWRRREPWRGLGDASGESASAILLREQDLLSCVTPRPPL